MAIAAQCPFYKYEKNKITFCEYASLHPPDKRARDEIVFNYCADAQNYKSCPFCIALEHYYARKYTKGEGTNDK